MADRKAMIAELKRTAVVFLRDTGFKGSFPHFRRAGSDAIDLLTFQFDRNGGGLVIEIARCPTDGYRAHWGKHIAPQDVKAWDIPPEFRKRLQARQGSGTDSWFRFDTDPVMSVAAQISGQVAETGIWNDVEIHGGPSA